MKKRGYIRYEFELPEEVPARLIDLDERMIRLDNDPSIDVHGLDHLRLIEELEIDIKSMYLYGMITNLDLPIVLRRYGLDG